MLEENMKDRQSREAVVDIVSKTLKEFVCFIYGVEVKDIEVAIDLLSVAHVYQFDDLKLFCVKLLMTNVNEDNALKILKVADGVNEENLKRNCISFIKM